MRRTLNSHPQQRAPALAPADLAGSTCRVVAALLLALAGSGMLALSACGAGTDRASALRPITVDADGPRNPWGKGVGDIDGDGRPDLVVGGHGPKPPALLRRVLGKLGFVDSAWSDQSTLVWYQSPGWKPHLVSDRYRIRTDIEVIDVDGDGLNDIVAVTDQGLVWFKNPDWSPTLVDARVLHDVEVADLDGDGKVDMVARNQQLFGHGDGGRARRRGIAVGAGAKMRGTGRSESAGLEATELGAAASWA